MRFLKLETEHETVDLQTVSGASDGSDEKHFFSIHQHQHRRVLADFTASSNGSSFVFGALSLASTSGPDSKKLNSRLLFTVLFTFSGSAPAVAATITYLGDGVVTIFW
jgi:hypothetical protein